MVRFIHINFCFEIIQSSYSQEHRQEKPFGQIEDLSQKPLNSLFKENFSFEAGLYSDQVKFKATLIRST